ncbi:MAG: glycosyltransferase family 4 protein, partial [Lachnospiraceae bacterium]|nr:glycosyltransferase family 4 protein [Lachnospiraceae bacterium]
MRVVQLGLKISYGDAVSNDLLAIDSLLKAHGIESLIYAREFDRRYRGRVKSFQKIPALKKDDILLYHMAAAGGFNEYIRRQSCIKVIRYHNLTPPHFYKYYNEGNYRACIKGISEVKELRDYTDYCINDSDYNSSDLRKYGYGCPMYTVPIIMAFTEYDREVDPVMYNRLKDGRINILFTGRMVPNKKIEDLIEVFYYYKKYWNENARIILAGSFDKKEAYCRKLLDYIEKLGINDIYITGHIPFESLLACYKASDVYLSLSEHEGFCVPLVEAMYFNIPIVTYTAGAVSSTMGDNTITLKSKDPIETAGVVDRIVTDGSLRENIIKTQKENLKRFLPETTGKQFIEAIKHISENYKINEEKCV